MKASDFMKNLEKNPEYNKKKKEKEEKLRKKIDEFKVIEAPFIKNLHENGFTAIKSSSDLLQLKKVNERLAMLLLEWISKTDNEYELKGMLVRSLAISETPFDGKVLTQLFDRGGASPELKWAISNTIASAQVENIADWLEMKFTVFGLGKEYEMLVYALPKYLNYSKARRILKTLFTTYPLQVSGAFAMIGNVDDLEFLEHEIENYKGVVRTGINKSIKKLKKKLQ